MVFKGSNSNASMMLYNLNSYIVIFLRYVDDILVNVNNLALILDIISRLNSKFSLKELVTLGYFLGVEVTNMDEGLYLYESNYIKNLFEKVQLNESKHIATPMAM